MLAQDDHLPELYGKLLDRFAHLVAGVSTRENGRSGNSGQLDRSAIAIEAERDLPSGSSHRAKTAATFREA